MCPGKEVGTVEIATFLHYFVTRYRSVFLTKSLKAPEKEKRKKLKSNLLTTSWH